MAGSSYSTPGSNNSRIANSSLSWQGACDVDIADWVKTNEFIAVLWAVCGNHGGCSAAFEIQWRNLTDGGSWAALASGSGELRQGTGTSLVNGNSVGTSSGCQTSTDSEEVEGDNTTDALVTSSNNQYIEVQVAIDSTNALDAKEYEFRLYDNTAGAALTEVACSLTTEAGSAIYFQTAGEHAMAIAGDITRKISLPRMGGHAMAIAGTLLSAKKFFIAVGGHAMAIVGTLSTKSIYAQSVGGYSIPITGSIVKKIFLPRMGNHSMTITGTILRKTHKLVGGYALAIIGSLGATLRFTQSVGGHAMNIAGSLGTFFIEAGEAGINAIKKLFKYYY